MDQTAASEWLLKLIDQVRQSIPAELRPDAGWAGLTLLAVGLLVGIFGAYYARGLICAVLGGIGWAAGSIASETFDFPPMVGGVVGLLGFAAIGYYAYKILVGVLVGLLVSGVALFAYGHDTLLPEILNFSPSEQAADPSGEFSLPTPREQEAQSDPTLVGYIKAFGQYLRDRRPEVSQNATILSALALVLGFVFGTFSTRWALMLSCAAVGTVFANLGLAGFAEAYAGGGWEDRLAQHPNGTLAFIASCFVLSLLVQYRMTQQTTSPPAPQPPKK